MATLVRGLGRNASGDALIEERAPRSERSNQLSRWIEDAAEEVVRRLALLNEGAVPASFDDLARCCDRLSIGMVGIPRSNNSWTAGILGLPNGPWTIYFNNAAPKYMQARYLAHELAEYITREQSWHRSPPQNSSVGVHEVRHRIAQRVESLCCCEEG